MIKCRQPKREETRDRIIGAAGAVFAERGFRGTTIRQITARAGVNLAAVNYYFQDKGELYIRVLREAKRCATMIVIQDLPGNPRERLEGFIQRFLGYLLDPARPSWHARIITMEISNPTPALNVIVREITAPFFRDVRALIGEVVEGQASPEELDLFAVSVFSQCVFYASNRPIVEQLALDLGKATHRTERIAAHVAAFSLAGLHDFCARKGNVPPARRSPTSHLLHR